MVLRQPTPSDVQERASARIQEVARSMGARLPEMASALHTELSDSIPDLRGDPMILELLRASIAGNIETFIHLIQHSLPTDGIQPPTAAVTYAHRLAQRGTSSNALVRAYRLGQHRILDLAFAEIAGQEPDDEVAYAAAGLMHEAVFRYIDQVSERVVYEYEAERERWLATRNTVRSAMLVSLLAGQSNDVANAEASLGYRLRQHHLGMVIWDPDRTGVTADLRQLESAAAEISEALGAIGPPLFIAQDRSVAWAWIPLGRNSGEIDISLAQRAISSGTVRVALGTVGASMTGFRTTHLEARRAHAVAAIAAERAAPVTTYAEPGVRAAALLTSDVDAARALVADVLGPLAADDEPTERLRETLLVFLSEAGSFRTAGERLHVHRNTVKYRVDRAIEVRGRDLSDDRFNLELALLACRWLGKPVLLPAAS